jgi:ClpP class serine protease
LPKGENDFRASGLYCTGRVWAGSEALKLGLVDRIGSLDDAINEAAVLAKVKTYKTQTTLNIKGLK